MTQIETIITVLITLLFIVVSLTMYKLGEAVGMDKTRIEMFKQIEKLKKEIKKLVPTIYSCFAKVLYEDYGKTPDEIEEIFERTQEVWTQAANDDTIPQMIDWVKETTGIDVRGDEYI